MVTNEHKQNVCHGPESNSVLDVQVDVVPPMLAAIVKQAALARKIMVVIQSIILQFSLRVDPSCVLILGNSSR
jgi:hypothetical protein